MERPQSSVCLKRRAAKNRTKMSYTIRMVTWFVRYGRPMPFMKIPRAMGMKAVNGKM